MKSKLIVGAILLSIGAVANADTLAGGAIYGGPSQTTATCYLYNAGTGPVTVTTNSIIRRGTLTPLTLTYDDCSTLAAGATCFIEANIENGSAHSCRMVVSPSGADVRGSFEIRNSSAQVLSNTELR